MVGGHPADQKKKGESNIGDPHSIETNDGVKKKICMRPMEKQEKKK
jgi:hypothetical protein